MRHWFLTLLLMVVACCYNELFVLKEVHGRHFSRVWYLKPLPLPHMRGRRRPRITVHGPRRLIQSTPYSHSFDSFPSRETVERYDGPTEIAIVSY